VLEHLSEASQPLTLAQLAAMMRVPKTTLMRLLRAMESQGYLLHMPAGRGYVPGNRATTLALSMLRGSNIRRECRAVLRNLVRSLGETCNLTVPDAGRVLYVERIDTTAPLRMHLPPGTWVPMHCTASGKLFLASMPLQERRSILAQLPLTRHSPRTITDRRELEEELERIARRGVGIDNEEFVLGMVAVAVPVRGQGRQPGRRRGLPCTHRPPLAGRNADQRPRTARRSRRDGADPEPGEGVTPARPGGG
jgi:DNA-binding IclR family transcriptional regulator